MSFSSKHLVAAALVLLGCAVACGSEDESAPTPTATNSTCDTSLTYANFGQNFMNQYCISCHITLATGELRQDAPPDVNFDTLAMIESWKAEIDAWAAAGPGATNRLMPEPDFARIPTDAERAQLGSWLACSPLQ